MCFFTECDISVSKLFQFCWWYRYRFRKFLVAKKVLLSVLNFFLERSSSYMQCTMGNAMQCCLATLQRHSQHHKKVVFQKIYVIPNSIKAEEALYLGINSLPQSTTRKLLVMPFKEWKYQLVKDQPTDQPKLLDTKLKRWKTESKTCQTDGIAGGERRDLSLNNMGGGAAVAQRWKYFHTNAKVLSPHCH